MKIKILIGALVLLLNYNAQANCQGCCSSHKGVMCSGGLTMCGDRSGLSDICSGKGCDACGGTITPIPTSTYYFYYADLDGDGYGNPYSSLYVINQPLNYVLNDNDCDDTNPAIHSCLLSDILKIDYVKFTIWLDCARRGAVKFEYYVERDTGNIAREDNYYLDPLVEINCQQTNTEPYGNGYDRGHLVPANHLDDSLITMYDANAMTNILPQAVDMNRGAWLRTEEITECYRDIENLLIIGGVIWGNNTADDYFLKTHGVATPDAFWKVIIRGSGANEKVIGWIIPNTQDAKYNKLDSYISSIKQIEAATGETITTSANKNTKPKKSWVIPQNCQKN